jgi:hypothetical protein
MTYNRYENRNWREPRGRDDSRDERSQWRGDDDRGFFERAGDEIASWFGDDDAQRRREMDERHGDSDYRRPSSAYGPSDSSRGDYGRSSYDRYERSPRFRDEGYRRPYTGRFSGRSEGGGYRETGFDRSPMRESGFDRGAPRDDRFDRGSSQRGFSGEASGLHDPHYSEWRRRQIDSLDRDYHEYRRENEGRFESEFGQWRENRASKRQMLGSVKEHMTVVGSDGEHVGTVDKVRGDRIILTKSDSDDDRHHMLGCSMVDSIDGDTVRLNVPSEEAKAKAHSDARRESALFERDDSRDDGPHMLNRSFSGTY